MNARAKVREHELTIYRAVAVISILTLIVLGSTVLVVRILRSPDIGRQQYHGWRETPEIRIVMDSTADWARMMINDLFQSYTNGIRVLRFGSSGWLTDGNRNYRIDAGYGLTFVDIVYNTTVMRRGDIVGFFKGNNEFTHTRMFTDVVFEVNEDVRQVSIYLMLAGAGTTTFQFVNKRSGEIIWQDTITGNSFTQYTRRWMSPDLFFVTANIGVNLVFALVAGAIITIFAVNSVAYWRSSREAAEDSEGL